MEIEKLLEAVVSAGKLLIESGAEIYRVEETMVRMTQSYRVQEAESYVTATGIMMSIKAQDKTYTRICRVRSGAVDLHCIDQINALSRSLVYHPISVDELSEKIEAISHRDRYSDWVTILFGAIGAAGFALFFDGSLYECICSFFIGIVIRCLVLLLDRTTLNAFFSNCLGSMVAVLLSYGTRGIFPFVDVDIVIISSLMLLVPGLAITNAIRDTISGDYVSSLSRATEALLVALAIAVGAGVALRMVL